MAKIVGVEPDAETVMFPVCVNAPETDSCIPKIEAGPVSVTTIGPVYVTPPVPRDNMPIALADPELVMVIAPVTEMLVADVLAELMPVVATLPPVTRMAVLADVLAMIEHLPVFPPMLMPLPPPELSRYPFCRMNCDPLFITTA